MLGYVIGYIKTEVKNAILLNPVFFFLFASFQSQDSENLKLRKLLINLGY